MWLYFRCFNISIEYAIYNDLFGNTGCYLTNSLEVSEGFVSMGLFWNNSNLEGNQVKQAFIKGQQKQPFSWTPFVYYGM